MITKPRTEYKDNNRWGESAGSMSILAHITAYGGRNDNLFRGVVMNSGYTQPIISADEAQGSYDQLVANTNCSSSAHHSSLECLRELPYNTLMSAIGTTASVISYSGLNLTWGPRVEGPGGLIQKTFRQSIAEGEYLRLPVVAGECADEGTYVLEAFNFFYSPKF
jgi:acetylcholinesterase